jgi:hypothetical protein
MQSDNKTINLKKIAENINEPIKPGNYETKFRAITPEGKLYTYVLSSQKEGKFPYHIEGEGKGTNQGAILKIKDEDTGQVTRKDLHPYSKDRLIKLLMCMLLKDPMGDPFDKNNFKTDSFLINY